MVVKVQNATKYIKSKIKINPEIAIILGSGLGDFANNLENSVTISYNDIEGFVVSTAPSHKGQLVIGTLGGKNILCMQGRFHYYEGYSMSEITFPIRVMKELGIKKLIVTNSSGGIDSNLRPGDLLIINDHINLMGTNPLIGKNQSHFGPRFNDMTYAYDKDMIRCIKKAASLVNLPIKEGIYVACTGPSFETPAEINFFKIIGASCVGMSTVPEVIVSNHCGIKTCAITCITNMAAGILDQPLTEEEVFESTENSREIFLNLLKTTLNLI